MFLTVLTFIIALVLLIFASTQFFNILFLGYAPLFSTKKRNIKKILEQITITNNANIYELGCGFAWFLTIAEKKFPYAKYVGIEYSFLPYMFSKIRLKILGSNIKLIKQNFLKTNLSDADIIYCYLIPDMMERLSKKIKNECRPGTKIISHRFIFPGITLEETINFGIDKFYFQKL